MQKYIGIFTVGSLFAISSVVNAAGFDGAQVTVTGYCCTAPIESDRFTVPATKIVGSGIEFPAGSIQTIRGIHLIGANVDIGTSTISFDYAETNTAFGGLFNGDIFDFSGSNLSPIVGVSVNPLSTFPISSIGLSFDADTVRINVPGLHFTSSSQIIVDVTFASTVPEPETYAMLLAGLALLSFISRRRKISSK